MPWPFGPSDRDTVPGGNATDANRHERRAKWRRRRSGGAAAGHPAGTRPPAAAPVLFESYEPRLLLSGVPAGTVLSDFALLFRTTLLCCKLV